MNITRTRILTKPETKSHASKRLVDYLPNQERAEQTGKTNVQTNTLDTHTTTVADRIVILSKEADHTLSSNAARLLPYTSSPIQSERLATARPNRALLDIHCITSVLPVTIRFRPTVV